MEHVASVAKSPSALDTLLRRVQSGEITIAPPTPARCQECGEHPADCQGHRPVLRRAR